MCPGGSRELARAPERDDASCLPGGVQLVEDLSLELDPLLPLKAGSYRFSTEGVPARRQCFVRQGRLVTPILDLKYAARLHRDPTAIPYSMDVLHLGGPEPLGQDEAMALAEDGVMVLNVLGVHTLDASSGHFSLSAPQALALRHGALGGRLRGTISGDLFALLRDDGTHLVRFDGETTPGLLVRCHWQ